MTDKQIIDRVNVKECRYYCNGKCERYEEFVEADYANYSVKCICEKENDLGTHDICDYQQLKRKEKEFEGLKAENNTYKSSIVANLDKSISKRYRELLEENDQLKQTLAEIKEIAEKNKNSTLCFTAFESDVIEVDNKPMTAILQKINEVENEKNM